MEYLLMHLNMPMNVYDVIHVNGASSTDLLPCCNDSSAEAVTLLDELEKVLLHVVMSRDLDSGCYGGQLLMNLQTLELKLIS